MPRRLLHPGGSRLNAVGAGASAGLPCATQPADEVAEAYPARFEEDENRTGDRARLHPVHVEVRGEALLDAVGQAWVSAQALDAKARPPRDGH
jgi:hypothetical protein